MEGTNYEKDDVRFDAGRVKVDAGDIRDAFREIAGIRVVVRKPVNHGLKRNQAGRGEDAGLPHSSPHHFALPPSLRDKF